MSFEGLPIGAGDKKRSFRESIYLWEILRGLGVTARHLVRNIFHTGEMPTMQYPEEKRVYGDRFRLHVTIPANTTAKVYVPAGAANQVTESGKPLSEAEHVQILEPQDDRVVLLIESGSYEFESTGGIRPADKELKTSVGAHGGTQ